MQFENGSQNKYVIMYQNVVFLFAEKKIQIIHRSAQQTITYLRKKNMSRKSEDAKSK